jgi:hypothetical protein
MAVVAGCGASDLALREDPDNCVLEMRLAASLGAEADPASAVNLSRVSLTAVGQDGYLLADDGTVLVRYGRDGSFVDDMLRRGAGPGELMIPTTAAADASDSIWISEPRGRVVVYDSRGGHGRTIVDAGLFPVRGFTPRGNPYSVLARYGRTPDADRHGLVQVWTRDLQAMAGVGPGAFHAEAVGRSITSDTPVLPLDDTTFLAGGRGEEQFLVEWTPSLERVILTRAQVLDELRRLGESDGINSVRPRGILADGSGGAWIIAAGRIVSAEEEAELLRNQLEELRLPPGAVLAAQGSPRFRNATWDGLLIHLSRQMAITDVLRFDEFPWAAVGPDAIYTARELDSGLVVIDVWTIARSCAGAAATRR